MSRPSYHQYRAVIKGPAASAVREAQRRGFTVIQVLQDGANSQANNTIVTLEHTDSRVIAQWLAEGPNAPPFPNMALLFYKDDDTGAERKKVWIAEERGYKLDDDLDGLWNRDEPLKTYDVGDLIYEIYASRSGGQGKYVVRIWKKLRPVPGRANPELIWSRLIYAKDVEQAVLSGSHTANAESTITSGDIERLREAVREQRHAPKQGFKMDDDLEGFGEFHPWAVSTLVPGLHGKPRYMYFDEFGEALEYARDRARKGKLVRDGGRAYFILDNVAGGATHRVIRAHLGAEQNSRGKHYVEKREFILVQAAEGTIPGHPDRTRWVTDKKLSVEV